MKITIESTTKTVTLNGVPARIWQGTTSMGVAVHCYVTLIGPQTHDAAALAVFDAEFTECAVPSPEIETIPWRFLI